MASFFSSVQRDRTTFLFICSTSWPTNFLVSEKQESVGSILAQNHKFFMLPKYSGDQRVQFLQFFWHYATFFRKVWNFIKGYPLNFLEFSVCKQRLLSLKGLFLGFSTICDFFTKYFYENKIFQMFPFVVSRIFLSLRYEADLGRSRLVELK